MVSVDSDCGGQCAAANRRSRELEFIVNAFGMAGDSGLTWRLIRLCTDTTLLGLRQLCAIDLQRGQIKGIRTLVGLILVARNHLRFVHDQRICKVC